VTVLRLLGRFAAAARRLGAGRLLSALRDGADTLFLALRYPPLRARVDGVEVRGFLRHRSFLAHLSRGDYETFARRIFVDELDKADVIVDVGAHVGFYTLLAALRRPGGRVVAIEADPYNAGALRANVRRARVANVEIVAKAASERSGVAAYQQNLGTVGSSLIIRPGTGPTRTIEVPTTTIDEVLGDVDGHAILVKIDVEGAERTVLRGATTSFRRALGLTAFVEVNPRALSEAGSTPSDLLDDLAGLGLTAAYIDEEQQKIVPAGSDTPKGNLVCRRDQ
jgi:FkbM family methyltransferase